jgi:hypothetical protein
VQPVPLLQGVRTIEYDWNSLDLQLLAGWVKCWVTCDVEATAFRNDHSYHERQEVSMEAVHAGQCGLCTHFGETHASNSALVTILKSHEAPLNMLDECGHPKHASLHLKVTPISGCDGFAPAAQA